MPTMIKHLTDKGREEINAVLVNLSDNLKASNIQYKQVINNNGCNITISFDITRELLSQTFFGW